MKTDIKSQSARGNVKKLSSLVHYSTCYWASCCSHGTCLEKNSIIGSISTKLVFFFFRRRRFFLSPPPGRLQAQLRMLAVSCTAIKQVRHARSPLSTGVRGPVETRRSSETELLRRVDVFLALRERQDASVGTRAEQVRRSTLYEWVQRFREHRQLDLHAATTNRTAFGRSHMSRDRLLERVPQFTDQRPPTFGFRHTDWTTELLIVQLAREGIQATDITGTAGLARGRGSVGSVLDLSCPEGRRPGGVQKGASARTERSEATGLALLRCHHSDRDATVASRLGQGGATSSGADHRQSGQVRCLRDVQCWHVNPLSGPCAE